MKNKFDERQLWIRGNIFMRTVCYYIVLLLVNAFLADNGIVWASGFYMNITISMIPIALASLEMIFRGVYLPKTPRAAVLLMIMGVAVTAGLVFCLIDLAGGEKLIPDNMLTDNGAHLITFILFLTVVGCGLARLAIEHRLAKKID